MNTTTHTDVEGRLTFVWYFSDANCRFAQVYFKKAIMKTPDMFGGL